MTPLKPLLSVIVPAFNEEHILEQNLKVIYEYLSSVQEQFRWELIVVDDGSTDSTGLIADAFGAAHPGIVVLHHKFNFKLGQALRFAFNESKGDIVVVLDVDLSYSPSIIGRMLARMSETGAKIVIASPYTKGGSISNVPLLRRILSRWANRFLALTVAKDSQSDRLTTITGMVRAYDGKFLRRLTLKSMDVEINPEIIYKSKILRARITECPARLDWKPAVGTARPQKGKRSSLRVARSMLHHVLSGYIFRPFMFFIVPGVFILALSLYPLTWTVMHTLRAFRQVAGNDQPFDYALSSAIGIAYSISPHSFIIGGISLLVAIQLISLGLLSLQKKRYFEELFYLSTVIHKDLRQKNDQ